MKVESKNTHLRLEELYNRLVDLQDNPPGGDIYMGAFYSVVAGMIGSGNTMRETMEVVLEKRQDITSHHLANLLFRVAQWQVLFRLQTLDLQYPEGFNEKGVWEKKVEQILSTDGNSFTEALKTRDTGTTLYQRYAGPKYVLTFGASPGDRAIKVTDWGCGRNHGIPGLMMQVPFREIGDETGGSITQTINEWDGWGVTGLGVDQNDAVDFKLREWQLACSFYPEELRRGEMDGYIKFEDHVGGLVRETFRQADIRNPLQIQGLKGSGNWDAVILSTVLYQMNPEDGRQVIKNGLEVLGPNGLLIIQDFVRKNGGGWLDFNRSWFGEPFGYRTLVLPKKTGEILEVLQWENGRCRKVREGDDFDKFQSIVE